MTAETITKLIQRKVSETFIHVIDPNYGKHKDELLAVHAGEKPVLEVAVKEAHISEKPFTPRRSSGGFGGGGFSDRTYGC